MNDLGYAFGIGAISGSRSLLGPAVAGTRLLPPMAERVLGLLAVGEMVADKSARIPARTTAVPLLGRALTGAIAAAASAGRRHRLQAAVVGAAGAVSAAFALYHLRRLATTRLGVPNVVAGLAEDALAMGAGVLLQRRPV